MPLATTKGKEFAQQALIERRKRNENIKKIDNAALYAGEPMYYYCGTCNGLAAVLPEAHLDIPPKYCDECQALIDLGWMI